MKNISKKNYERLRAFHNGAMWLDSYLQAIVDAEFHIAGLEEKKDGYACELYIWLTMYDPEWYKEPEFKRLYLKFGDDDRTCFYVGKEKAGVGYARFNPEGITKFLQMWRELQKYCADNC